MTSATPPKRARRRATAADPSGPAAVVAIRLAPRHKTILRRHARKTRTTQGGAVRRWLEELAAAD